MNRITIEAISKPYIFFAPSPPKCAVCEKLLKDEEPVRQVKFYGLAYGTVAGIANIIHEACFQEKKA